MDTPKPRHSLEKEIATYRSRLPELLNEEGRFVVIHGEKVLGTYGDYEDALRAGYQTIGVKPFLVKRITEIEPVHFSSRSYQTTS